MKPLLSCLALALATLPSRAADFIVDSTADAGPGTLRQAILDANATPGADVIVFNLAGGPDTTLVPASALPTITDTVDINGTSQPGYFGTPIVTLDGSAAAGVRAGLVIEADDCAISGLVIQGWSGDGIELAGNRARISRCYIGVDASGVDGLGNLGAGLRMTGAGHWIGGTFADGNLISQNVEGGILLTGDAATNNVIAGNRLGTDAEGSFSLPQGFAGIVVAGTGTAANDITGNLISGTTGPGLIIAEGATDTRVSGNRIGTDLNGQFPVGNFGDGVILRHAGNVWMSGNVISGNLGAGVRIDGTLEFSARAELYNNAIGCDVTEQDALGNGLAGIIAENVGGVILGQPGGGNTISGNDGPGVILVRTEGVRVSANRIGLDGSGTFPLYNFGTGISLVDARNTEVGGEDPDNSRANFIAYNFGSGIGISGNLAVGNRLLGNSLHDNACLGISLDNPVDPCAPLPNDPGDTDPGPNGHQNHPVLTAVSCLEYGIELGGILNSRPDTDYTIEVYGSGATDPSGSGEGEVSGGRITVRTDAAGHATFSLMTAGLTLQSVFTATATDEATGNTSEFSPALLGRPVLNIGAVAGDRLTLSWSTNCGPWTLEATTDLTPPVTWEPVPGTPVVIGDQAQATVPLVPAVRFFRLRGQ